MFRRQKADMVENEDMFFDAKEYHTANKNVSNILSSDKSGATGQAGDSTASGQGETKEAVEEATLVEDDAWGGGEDDIEIDMGDDVLGGADIGAMLDADGGVAQDSAELDCGIFVPPSAGADPLQ